MSTPPSPRPAAAPSGPGHPTRQLLDELDALMQRMLALPVNALGDELRARDGDGALNAPAGAGADVLTLQGTSSVGEDAPADEELVNREAGGEAPTGGDVGPPALRHQEAVPQDREAPDSGAPAAEILGDEAGRPEADEPDWKRSIPASPEVLAAIGQNRPREAEERKRGPGSIWRTEVGPLPRVAVPSAPPAAGVPGWLRPLLWSNRAFDWCTAWLGSPGRWLRGIHGRALLGWVGLGLLAGGLAWMLVTELDWTW